jgi:hypothetical protein
MGTSATTHEIALNPETFGTRTPEQVLSTLAHELAHHYQLHTGTAPRAGYHNVSFAELMQSIGLPVSSTGKPGGKRTGYQMTHWIEQGGRFMQVIAPLLEGGFRARWAERFVHAEHALPPDDVEDDEDGRSSPAPIDGAVPRALNVMVSNPQRAGIGTGSLEPPIAKPFAGSTPPAFVARPDLFRVRQRESQRKTKYVCSGCRAAVWGKAGLELSCRPCATPLHMVRDQVASAHPVDRAADQHSAPDHNHRSSR